MMFHGPFGSIQAARIAEELASDDPKVQARARQILNYFTNVNPAGARLRRDVAIWALARLLRDQQSGVSQRRIAATIESALLKRRACPHLNRLSEPERRAVDALAVEIRFWMTGKKQTLSAVEIGRIVKRGR